MRQEAAHEWGTQHPAIAGRNSRQRIGNRVSAVSLRSEAANALGNLNAVCLKSAPVAQLDRANASGALGREFESLRAHHLRIFTFPLNQFEDDDENPRRAAAFS